MTDSLGKFTIKEPKKLNQIFKAYLSAMDEANVRFNNLGMNLRGMGHSQVTLTDITIPKEIFESYPDLNDEGITFRVSLENLVKVLDRSKTGDSLEIEITTRTLNLVINSKYKKTYQLSMTEFDKEKDKLPKVLFANELHGTLDTFDEIIKDIKLMADHIRIEIQDKKLTINGTARDQNSGTMLDFMNDEGLKVVRNDKPVKQDYDPKMFESIVSILKGSESAMEIELDERTPMRIMVNIKGFGLLHHFVAPFIKD